MKYLSNLATNDNYCKHLQILVLNCVIQEIMFIGEIWSKKEKNHELSILTSQLGWKIGV
jgi:hypothetical protein